MIELTSKDKAYKEISTTADNRDSNIEVLKAKLKEIYNAPQKQKMIEEIAVYAYDHILGEKNFDMTDGDILHSLIAQIYNKLATAYAQGAIHGEPYDSLRKGK